MTNFQATLVNAGYGQLALRDSLGRIAQKWTLSNPKCVIGTSTNCNVSCNLPGIADHHALLVIGARQVFLRALAPGLTRAGENVSELLIPSHESELAFELAGHHFVYSRQPHSQPAQKEFVLESARSQVSEPAQMTTATTSTASRKSVSSINQPVRVDSTSATSPTSDRLRFTFVRALEKNRQQLQDGGAGSSQHNGANERPAWVEEIVRDALRPVESRLDDLSEPLNNIQRRLRREARQRKLRRDARRAKPVQPPVASLPPELIESQFKYEQLAGRQSSRLDQMQEQVHQLIARLATVHQLTSSTNNSQQELNQRTSQSNQEIARLQHEMLTLVAQLKSQLERPATSDEQRLWQSGIEAQLAELQSSMLALEDIKHSLALSVSQADSLRNDWLSHREELMEAVQTTPSAAPSLEQLDRSIHETITRCLNQELNDSIQASLRKSMLGPLTQEVSDSLAANLASQLAAITEQFAGLTNRLNGIPGELSNELSNSVQGLIQNQPAPLSAEELSTRISQSLSASLVSSLTESLPAVLAESLGQVLPQPVSQAIIPAVSESLSQSLSASLTASVTQTISQSLAALPQVSPSPLATHSEVAQAGSAPLPSAYPSLVYPANAYAATAIPAAAYPQPVAAPSDEPMARSSRPINDLSAPVSASNQPSYAASSLHTPELPGNINPAIERAAYEPAHAQPTPVAPLPQISDSQARIELTPVDDTPGFDSQPYQPMPRQPVADHQVSYEPNPDAHEGFASAAEQPYDQSAYQQTGYDSAQYDSTQYNSAQYNSAQYDSAQYASGQHGSSQYDSSQYDSSAYQPPADSSARPEAAYHAAPPEPVAPEAGESFEVEADLPGELPSWWTNDTTGSRPVTDGQADSAPASPSNWPGQNYFERNYFQSGQEQGSAEAQAGGHSTIDDHAMPTGQGYSASAFSADQLEIDRPEVAGFDSGAYSDQIQPRIDEPASSPYGPYDSTGYEPEAGLSESANPYRDDQPEVALAGTGAGSGYMGYTPGAYDTQESAEEQYQPLPEHPTQSVRAVDSPTVRASDVGQSNEDNDESVEDYMRRLLARMRGVSESEVTLPGAEPSRAASQSAPREQMSVKPVAAMDPIQDSEPISEAWTEPFDPDKYVPRGTAPEKNKDLNAMRELANTSARSAIQVSARRRQGTAILIKSTICLVGLIAGIALVSINGARINIAFIATIASFLVAFIWGYDTITSLRPLVQSLRSPKEPVQEKSED